jgi:hypothetical protein
LNDDNNDDDNGVDSKKEDNRFNQSVFVRRKLKKFNLLLSALNLQHPLFSPLLAASGWVKKAVLLASVVLAFLLLRSLLRALRANSQQ